MHDLLRRFIAEAIAEVQDFRVPNQLLPKGSKAKAAKSDADSEKEDEIDEVNVVGNIAGMTGPLGASNLDMGADHAVAGKAVRKRKKTFARWK